MLRHYDRAARELEALTRPGQPDDRQRAPGAGVMLLVYVDSPGGRREDAAGVEQLALVADVGAVAMSAALPQLLVEPG